MTCQIQVLFLLFITFLLLTCLSFVNVFIHSIICIYLWVLFFCFFLLFFFFLKEVAFHFVCSSLWTLCYLQGGTRQIAVTWGYGTTLWWCFTSLFPIAFRAANTIASVFQFCTVKLQFHDLFTSSKNLKKSQSESLIMLTWKKMCVKCFSGKGKTNKLLSYGNILTVWCEISCFSLWSVIYVFVSFWMKNSFLTLNHTLIYRMLHLNDN